MIDWISLHVHAGSVPALQPLLERVVAPFVAGDLPWFFIRYHDWIGPHVRLRVQGPLHRLAEVQRRALAELPDVRIRLYQPEYAKFGGGDGMASAERLFHAASETALGCFGPGYWERRLATAAVHLREVTAVLTPDQRQRLLVESAGYWTSLGGASGMPVERLAGPFTRMLAGTLPRVLDDTRLGAAMTGYAQVLGAGLPPHRPDLLMQHIHLMNNRLGLTMIEEGLLAHVLAGPLGKPGGARRRGALELTDLR